MTAVEQLIHDMRNIDMSILNDEHCKKYLDMEKAQRVYEFGRGQRHEQKMSEELILDIDMKLALMEDYAKGEVGDEITKLRGFIDEQLRNKH